MNTQLTPEYLFKILEDKNMAIDAVVCRLNFDKTDLGMFQMMAGMVKRQMSAELEVLAWKYLQGRRIPKFKDFLQKKRREFPEADLTATLLQFVFEEDSLREVILKDFDLFLARLIDDFNRLAIAGA